MRWRSRSMSSTLTCTVSPMLRISLGWLTCDHESSEMWIRPSMPSRSTNAPKSTMFEIWPSTTRPGWRRSRICLALLLALLLEHGAAAQDDVVARAVELDDLGLDRLAEVLVEVRHAADVDERGGQEAAHPEVDDQAALDDLDDGAARPARRTRRPPRCGARPLEAGALLGEDQAAVLVLLGEDEGVDLLAELDLLVRVDRLADRELVGGDDPLALVADVDEDLVLVDAHDPAGDDVALLEGDDRRVVVGDDLAVDLEQQSVGALDDLGVGRWSASVVAAMSGRLANARPGQPGRALVDPRDARPSDQARRRAHAAGRRVRRR